MTEPDRSNPVRLSADIELLPWQQRAVDSWIQGDDVGAHRGTLEIFTGGGKTLIALAAFARVSAADPRVRLAVVVPTEALARQWVTSIVEHTGLASSDVAMLGAGKRGSFEGKRALVAVLNSAARKLPELARGHGPLMLVIDECHRAGAAGFSKVLDTPAEYRLGLSATPARDEVDENGLPLAFDQQVVGQKLGDVVFRFGLREARDSGWLPNYTVHHHGVRLTPAERLEYERISRKVSDAADRMTSVGLPTARAIQLAQRGGESSALAQGYIGALATRKDFLYRASERSRVAARIVERALSRAKSPRMLLFHERVAEAAALHADLTSRLPGTPIALEHSDLPDRARREALLRFRSGEVDVLVSVKSLVEGIDVPDADIGVSVASSSSVRQRIQTLGRVLRRRFDGEAKEAEMHVLYVHDTVDESIYGKEDWSDLTGEDANRYWLWPLDPDLPPEAQAGPPQKPKPTEESEWQRLGGRAPEEPIRWLGELPELELSVDTRGNVTSSEGASIENAQGVAQMVERVRGRPGGRFRVTPQYHLVLVFGESEGGMVPFVAGQLGEPLRVRETPDAGSDSIDITSLAPGELYRGPTDRVGGTFKIRQKRGGLIERKQGALVQFASMDSSEGALAENARRVIDAWKALGTTGMTFYVNRLDHAWYREEGEARFLAEMPGGFAWPSDAGDEARMQDQPRIDGE